uniref:type IV pilus twitching motility protein PilT n=1 Tax=uncultured Campylobacter sp. TaxID=218934 RepID=UPI0028E4E12C
IKFNDETALNSDLPLLQARADLASENGAKIIDEVHKDVPEVKDEDLPCLKEAELDVELKPAIDILDYVPYEPSEDEDEANDDAILSEEPKFSKNLEQATQADEKSAEELNLQTPSLMQEKSEKSDDKENSAPKFIIKNEEKLEKMHESKPQAAAQEINLKQTKERLDEQNLDARSVARLNLSPKNEPAKPARGDRAALLADLVADVAEPFAPQGFGIGAATAAEDDSEERAEIKNKLDEYLLKLIEGGGSDLHVKSGKVVRGRFNGEIVKMGDRVLDYDRAVLLAKEILGTNYYNLMKKKNVDFTYKLNDDFRFRANVFLQMDGVSFVFRTIPTRIPTMSELLLPPIIEKLCDKVNRGIILVTGPTGSGKTTTLASMINYLNHTKNYHIVTIEDPIEFIYNDDRSVINQRAIGQDVDSFADALRASMREDPDVIFVGEMRDLETVRTAINAAETGHLVLATLHTLDAKETIGRVINMFPKEEQNRIRMTFASVSEAIISQRLVLTTAGKRRVACEIMVKNIRVRDMILEDRDSEIYDAIEQSKNTYGMQTFEQHLLDMYTAGVITKEEALRSASRRENLDIKIKSADLAKKRAMVASIEEDDELLKEFQSEIIALKDIK